MFVGTGENSWLPEEVCNWDPRVSTPCSSIRVNKYGATSRIQQNKRASITRCEDSVFRQLRNIKRPIESLWHQEFQATKKHVTVHYLIPPQCSSLQLIRSVTTRRTTKEGEECHYQTNHPKIAKISPHASDKVALHTTHLIFLSRQTSKWTELLFWPC